MVIKFRSFSFSSGSSYSDNLQPFDRSIANAMARNKTEAKVCISVLKKHRGKIYIPTRELVQRTRFGVHEIPIETATRQNGGNLKSRHFFSFCWDKEKKGEKKMNLCKGTMIKRVFKTA